MLAKRNHTTGPRMHASEATQTRAKVWFCPHRAKQALVQIPCEPGRVRDACLLKLLRARKMRYITMEDTARRMEYRVCYNAHGQANTECATLPAGNWVILEVDIDTQRVLDTDLERPSELVKRLCVLRGSVADLPEGSHSCTTPS